MRFVKGKRQIAQEKVFGFVKVTEPYAGVASFIFVIGTMAWGIQWKIKRNVSASNRRT